MSAVYVIPTITGMFLVGIILFLFWMKKKYQHLDPVTECDLYKNEGCSHVDGFLCDVESCSMRKEYLQDKEGQNKCQPNNQ